MSGKPYLEMHLAVVLYGFTAILGKVISINAVAIVWWRVFFTSLSLLLILRGWRLIRQMTRKDLAQYGLAGALIALHWITFFLSIHLSNASICLMTLATQSFFTALLEPLVLKRRIKLYELLLGVLMIPAMILIVSEVDITMRLGIWIGLLSSLLVAAFTSLNKTLVDRQGAFQITFIELTAAWLFVTIMLPFLPALGMSGLAMPQGNDWIYLVILALLCTTFAFGLSLRALRSLSAFSTNLIANLEPVYGIVLAWLLLHEHTELTPGFYLGSAIMVAIVFANPLVEKYMLRRYG